RRDSAPQGLAVGPGDRLPTPSAIGNPGGGTGPAGHDLVGSCWTFSDRSNTRSLLPVSPPPAGPSCRGAVPAGPGVCPGSPPPRVGRNPYPGENVSHAGAGDCPRSRVGELSRPRVHRPLSLLEILPGGSVDGRGGSGAARHPDPSG